MSQPMVYLVISKINDKRTMFIETYQEQQDARDRRDELNKKSQESGFHEVFSIIQSKVK